MDLEEDIGGLEMLWVSYAVDFEAELFTGIDKGMNVSERIQHPYFAFTPFDIIGHCIKRGGQSTTQGGEWLVERVISRLKKSLIRVIADPSYKRWM
jgi:hypothetical protein